MPGRPSIETMQDWAITYPDYGDALARARIHGAHALASECLVIADAWRKDKSPDAHPMAGAPSDDRRLAVWTRLQLLARWFPSLYGERKQLQHEHQHRMVVLQTNAPLPDGTSAPLPRTPAQVTVTEGPAEGVRLELPSPVAERIADETATDDA